MIAVYILYFLLGIVFGGFGTLLFFRFDKQWKQVITGVSDIAGSSAIGVAVAEYFQVPQSRRVRLFVFFLIVTFM